MNPSLKTIAVMALLGTGGAWSQQPAGDDPKTFAGAATSIEQQLKSSLHDLDDLRQQIARETLPLSRALSTIEGALAQIRLDYQQTSRLLDGRTLDLGNLHAEIKSRHEEKNYLSNLLGEYMRGFQSSLHIAEINRYKEIAEMATLAAENRNFSEIHAFAAQTDLAEASLTRIEEALGGAAFAGKAVDREGMVRNGKFFLLGPCALFRSDDGEVVGTAEQRLGSLEPSAIVFDNPLDTAAASQLVALGHGHFPVDPTLGSAHKVAATKETLVEHIKKGGVVMAPILGLAAAAALVALYKWLAMLFVRRPSGRRIRQLLDAISRHDRGAADAAAGRIAGPVGRMLRVGVEHLKEPSELIEEVMYENVLTTRLKLQRFLPFVAISAASAPLLGLLGTVTGIINTFKLITVFGSGDVKTLSGGISEALITTEFGLIVAIPSLLLHAFLSRKARGIVDQMEKAAVAFINQVNKSPFKHTRDIQEGA